LDGEIIFGVDGEEILDLHASSGAERQPLEAFVLTYRWIDVINGRFRRRGTSDRRATDFSSHRQILLEKRNTEPKRSSDIVKRRIAARFGIRRQQFPNIEVNSEQIAHNILVLSTIQAVQRFRTAWVEAHCGRAIQRRL